METATKRWTDLSVAEWNRLSEISRRHESAMRLAFTTAVQSRRQVDTLSLRGVITTVLVEVCDTTAPVYGMVFNPNSPIYLFTIDRLTDKFVRAVTPGDSREAVSSMLPPDLGVTERAERLNTFGLDSGAARRLEKMRQEGKSLIDISRERERSIMIRGNMIATTETNRVVNHALIALWRDNTDNELVAKARRPRRGVEYRGMSRRAVMAGEHKTWVTRRDEKVCKYCDPLDGITARLDAEFDTKYGIFETPPIHPNCRCFMVLG